MSEDHVTVHVLWARCDRYPRPQFVAAWADGYVESWHEAYAEERDEKLRWFRDFGDPDDDAWTFWTTVEHITPNGCEHQFQQHPLSEDVGVCSSCGVEEVVA